LQLFNRGKWYPCGLNLVRGKGPETNGFNFVADVTNNVPHSIAASVRKTKEQFSLTIHFDGRQTLQWQGPEADLSLMPMWDIPGKGTVGIGAWDGRIVFRTLQAVRR
jgi:hypothetical protein